MTAIDTLDAGEHTLTAWSLEALAELVDCALEAGDPLERMRAAGRDGPRPVMRLEFAAVGLLADERG